MSATWIQAAEFTTARGRSWRRFVVKSAMTSGVMRKDCFADKSWSSRKSRTESWLIITEAEGDVTGTELVSTERDREVEREGAGAEERPRMLCERKRRK